MPLYTNAVGKQYYADVSTDANDSTQPFIRAETKQLLEGEAPQSPEVITEILTAADKDKTLIQRFKDAAKANREAKAAEQLKA